MRFNIFLYIKKIYTRIVNIYGLFFFDKHEAAFKAFSNKNWSKNPLLETKGQLLIETTKQYSYLFQIAYQSNFLADKFQLEIKTIVNSYYGKNRWLNQYLNKYLSVTKLFSSFGASKGLDYYSLNQEVILQHLALADDAFNALEKKSDLVKLEIEGVIVGDLVYDTYLRQYNQPTVDIKDSRLLTIIKSAYIIFASSKKYLNDNDVRMVVTLHATYIQNAIIIRLALLKNIPVYMYAHREGRLNQKLTLSHMCQIPNHSEYKKRFNRLKNKKEAVRKAKKMIDSRMAGKVDAGISYMKQSAYSSDDVGGMEVFASTSKPRVIIFLHCFFDSPHIYKGMLFEDFYEWLDFTLKIASTLDYACYVKPHPNGLKGNDDIVQYFKNKYPNITFVNKNLSNKSIMGEKFIMGVTSHGTVAHELAYHGIPALVAGDNPHAVYDFCYTAKSISDYENRLRNPLRGPWKISQDEITQFFYMHYLYQSDIYVGGVGNWSGHLQLLRDESQSSMILSGLIEKAQNGDFDKVDSFFEDVITHLEQ